MAATMAAVVGRCDMVMFVLTAEAESRNWDKLKEKSLPDPTW